MIEVKDAYEALVESGVDMFTGVPDSLLKNICAYITDTAPKEKHIIAANEGNAVGIAAGHYLATGKPALGYKTRKTKNKSNKYIVRRRNGGK